MFIVKFQGGLGNQLFQYAAGLGSSLRRHEPMKMDLTGYGILGGDRTVASNSDREPDILDFAVSSQIASAEEVAQASAIRFGVIGRKLRAAKYRYLVDSYISYRTGFFGPERGRYMDGYFQDERYFVNEWPLVSGELQLRPDKGAAMKSAKREVARAGLTVSLHVRRGDFVANDHNSSILDVCGPDYYRRALAKVAAAVPNFIVVVFSDDPDWVKANIDMGGRPVIYAAECLTENGSRLSAAQELMLMSRCSHHIIANSTFSWWGAYLNSSVNKVVVAPSRWVRGTSKSYDRLVPGRWVCIPAD